ncbi:hypothetical protein M427DRAFT_104550 [Gonapodya prolifera JEL478]|uniref:ER-bound oxygenase mpaB/mpaB'/Rubber oxygenase catalytic domain-containing protein n=1 Tax=Gonapodya prolifera (strain JEL478) TaxID=1344416 RepID=A0A138ZZQ6_GONPJ|nr:hypothetical protein M427DRAFT_104550 [Gonapodya prolifera JEL478]|eukprot:KXS09981.1 hypothetical protein M427DRAFT_104550 [Gonapodya prolifera JEL478]
MQRLSLSRKLILSLAPSLVILWVARNLSVRYKRRNEIQRRYGPRYAVSEKEETPERRRMINAGYTGVRDAQRITNHLVALEAPFISFTALEFALFKTYGIPTISSLLSHTGQLGKPENASRRFVDTSALISAQMMFPAPRLDLEGEDTPEPDDDLFSKGGADADPRAAIAVSRMNYLHGRWKGKISRDDLLYTLSLFMVEVPKWVDQFEWRQTTDLEKEALFTVWYHIGRCMGIADIPRTIPDLTKWVEDYESKHMVYAESNRVVAQYTISLLLQMAPKALHPALTKVIVALLEDRLRLAFNYDPSPRWLCALVPALLKARAAFIKYFLPPRYTPKAFCPTDAQARFVLDGVRGQVCPAVRLSAEDAAEKGKSCPVSAKRNASDTDPSLREYDVIEELPRMEPGWVENDPWYSIPATPLSPTWFYEKLFVKPEDRLGAARWQNSRFRSKVGNLAGFRLEEMGPKGMEISGREEVLKEAIRLNGGRPLVGPWAFKAKLEGSRAVEDSATVAPST